MSSDYQLEDTLHLPFTTRAFATGVPTVLAGTPAIDIYEDVTGTPIITGETLAVSLNSVAGFNMITVTATVGTGFEAGKSYTAVIETGTVGGVSVVGEVVAHFTLDKSAAAKDLANGTDGLGAIKAQTAAIETDTDVIGAAGAGLTEVALADGALDAAAIGADAITSAKIANDAIGVEHFTAALIAEIVDKMWDEVLTGGVHNVTNSAGRRLRELADVSILADETAQGGANGSITLAAGEDANDLFFDHTLVVLVSGTGAGQARAISNYNGTSKVALVSRNWVVNPVSGTGYIILSEGETHVAEVESGAIVAASFAAGAIDAAALKADAVAKITDDWETQSQADPTGFHVNMQEWLGAAVTKSAGDVPDVNVKEISEDSVAADRLEGLMDGILIAAVNDVGASTTAFAADGFTEATDDHFNGRLITFISGALSGQQTAITDYDAADGPQGAQEFTVVALTEAPGDGDFFVIH